MTTATLSDQRIDAATRSMLKDVAALYQRSTKVDVDHFFSVWDEIGRDMVKLREKQPGTMDIEAFFREAKKKMVACL